MHAPDKIDYPIATPQTLVEHDAFLFGVPTRYGNMPAQFKVIRTSEIIWFMRTYSRSSMEQSLWDATGQIWVQGALAGKYAGLFVSTGSPGGGQEMTISNYLSTLTHHGILFVPFGYATGLQRLISLEEVHGGEIRLILDGYRLCSSFGIGSPWGAGTYSAPDGSRKPTEREVEIAQAQGGAFYDIVSRVKWN